jgi:glycosyltransferase involved in cell wall biosynthesis
MDKIKLLLIADGGVATGFARVSQSIAENLNPEEFEIHQIAVNYNGDPYKLKNPNHVLYPARLGGDYLGLGRVKEMVDKVKPDVIFIINDPWLVNDYLTRIPIEYRVVAYVPIDAKPIDSVWVSNIQKINQLITYTNYGKSAFTDQIPEFADIKILPHGVDTSKFFPVDKMLARKKLGIPEDAFIVFNGNRNQPRKRVDLTIKAFAKFVQDKPDNVRLYLHMGTVDAGWDIDKLCKRYGVYERLIKTADNISPSSYVSDEDLNYIYNACDVGFNTSMGEGWGLISVEQSCCGIPQIVPNYSATAEIYSPSEALHLNVERIEPHQHILTEGCIIDIDHAAQCLNELYYNRELGQELAENAFRKFASPEYSWKVISEQFAQVLRDVSKQEPRAKLILENQEKAE